MGAAAPQGTLRAGHKGATRFVHLNFFTVHFEELFTALKNEATLSSMTKQRRLATNIILKVIRCNT